MRPRPSWPRREQQGEPSTEVERLWGLLYARAGRADDALPLLRRAWDGPGSEGRGPDPEVAGALARIAMQRFDLADAIDVLDRWAGRAPTDPRPLVMRSEIDRRIGVDRIVTIGHLREALRRDPTCDEARLSLAEILYIEGQYAESGEHYAAYAARHPDDAAGHVGVGIAARVQGEIAKAVAALDRALVLAPDDTLALRERAAIDLHAGHADDALRRLDRAIKADPFDPELRYQRSLALGRLGRRDEAVAERRRFRAVAARACKNGRDRQSVDQPTRRQYAALPRGPVDDRSRPRRGSGPVGSTGPSRPTRPP